MSKVLQAEDVGTLRGNFRLYKFWPYLNVLLKQQIKLIIICSLRQLYDNSASLGSKANNLLSSQKPLTASQRVLASSQKNLQS